MTVPKVVIFCDDDLVGDEKDDSARPTALSLSDALGSAYGVTDVLIRPVSVPIERILSTAHDLGERSAVCVVLTAGGGGGGGSPSATAADALERECPSPVLVLSAEDTAEECALRIARLCSPSSDEVRGRVADRLLRRRQGALIQDARIRTSSAPYARLIGGAIDAGAQITGDEVTLGDSPSAPARMRGKVRDRYDLGTRLALVTTDRQSGFDRMLAKVPYKGAVLNLVSAYWFKQTEHLVPNHLLAVPHPNVSIVKKCEPFPIEFVVR